MFSDKDIVTAMILFLHSTNYKLHKIINIYIIIIGEIFNLITKWLLFHYQFVFRSGIIQILSGFKLTIVIHFKHNLKEPNLIRSSITSEIFGELCHVMFCKTDVIYSHYALTDN
jgi:hypothetical protein